MIHRIRRRNSYRHVAVLVCALAPLFMARGLSAQEALTVPEGLPDWAFNIPDKIQPTAVRVADCRWVASNEFENYRFPAADQATMDLLLGIKRG